MASFIRNFFQGEFVIDEKPVAVWVRAKGASSDEETDKGDRHEDLLISLSHLMKEHDELSDLTEELKERNSASESEDMEPFMKKMLPFLDSFERILFLARSHDVPDEISNWLKSVESIYYRLLRLLESYGLVALQTTGHSVNLDLHEVVEVADAPDRPGGVIITERKKGYVYQGKLMRVASVVVARDKH